jgi:hypothetical protein
VTFFGLFPGQDKVYSNNRHTLDELKRSIREGITSVEDSELKVSNNLFKLLQGCLRREWRYFSTYSDGKTFEQLIYFQDWMYLFFMHGMLAATLPLPLRN